MDFSRKLIGSLGVLSLSAFAFPAQAQLASQSTQFSGSVPALCRVADSVNATTPMSFNGTTLSGVSDDFSFESNGNVNLQLRAVQIDSAPDNTGNYAWAGGLRINNGQQLASSTPQAASSLVNYPNGLTANDDFQLTLNISAPQGALMAQGTYVATVTADCIAPN